MCSVDIWFESLSNCEHSYCNYWDSLDFNERARAQRFVKEIDRKHFVISHGKLRLILASYLRLPANKIVLATQSYGKPFVIDDRLGNLKFNLSHSDCHMLVGVNHDDEIGVDIEKCTDNVNCEGVLDLCFSESERRFWQALSVCQRQAFFYRQWARKESFVKALGLGLGLDVSCVETSLEGSSQFLSLPDHCDAPENWSLIDLDLPDGLKGAVTVHSSIRPTLKYKNLANL